MTFLTVEECLDGSVVGLSEKNGYEVNDGSASAVDIFTVDGYTMPVVDNICTLFIVNAESSKEDTLMNVTLTVTNAVSVMVTVQAQYQTEYTKEVGCYIL